jgi:hypothetical protein
MRTRQNFNSNLFHISSMDDYSQYKYSQSSDSFYLNETPVEKLKRLWLNETFAPDLLPFDEDVINKIIVQIKQQVQNLESLYKYAFKGRQCI